MIIRILRIKSATVFLKLVGMDKVSLVNGRIVKSDPGISLDVNAIAQGYSVDVVCSYFDKSGNSELSY